MIRHASPKRADDQLEAREDWEAISQMFANTVCLDGERATTFPDRFQPRLQQYLIRHARKRQDQPQNMQPHPRVTQVLRWRDVHQRVPSGRILEDQRFARRLARYGRRPAPEKETLRRDDLL